MRLTAITTIYDPALKDADEVAKVFGADLVNSPTTPEPTQRLLANGANERRAAPPIPAWRRLVAHFQDPLIYLLQAAWDINPDWSGTDGRLIFQSGTDGEVNTEVPVGSRWVRSHIEGAIPRRLLSALT